MDWVHCNNCFHLPGNGKRFFLTSCGHIYCKDCIQECTLEHCKLCGMSCTSIPLSSQMKADVEMYFSDPFELLKKHVAQVHQVAEFQNRHRTRLLSYHKDQVDKMQNLKEDFKKAIIKIQQLESERSKLKKQIECLKQMINVQRYENPCNSVALQYENFKLTPEHSISGSLNKHSCENTPFSSRSEVSAYSMRSSASINTTSPFPTKAPRVTVRAPPSKGKIGIVPETPQNSELTRRILQCSGLVRDPDTTPKVIKGIAVSPMNISPCSSVNGDNSRGLCSVSSNHLSRSNPMPRSSLSSDYKNSRLQLPCIRQIKFPQRVQSCSFTKKMAVSPYTPEKNGNGAEP